MSNSLYLQTLPLLSHLIGEKYLIMRCHVNNCSVALFDGNHQVRERERASAELEEPMYYSEKQKKGLQVMR